MFIVFNKTSVFISFLLLSVVTSVIAETTEESFKIVSEILKDKEVTYFESLLLINDVRTDKQILERQRLLINKTVITKSDRSESRIIEMCPSRIRVLLNLINDFKINKLNNKGYDPRYLEKQIMFFKEYGIKSKLVAKKINDCRQTIQIERIKNTKLNEGFYED